MSNSSQTEANSRLTDIDTIEKYILGGELENLRLSPVDEGDYRLTIEYLIAKVKKLSEENKKLLKEE